MLSVRKIETFYGNVQALRGVEIEVPEGELTCVIGPNGAGKTTTLNTIAGLLKPRSGSILFEGEEIAKRSPNAIVDLGIALVPENRLLFPNMTVRENLLAGGYLHDRSSKDFKETYEEMLEVFPVLADRQQQLAGTLSGGEQQMCAIARALMARPRLLMMDEPSLGLAPLIVADIYKVIDRLGRSGRTVLLVEQNVRLAMEVADRFYVMEMGDIVFEGTPSELEGQEEIRKAYLGA
jgi:branched-chain amino acid transport system ATP-binding protein